MATYLVDACLPKLELFAEKGSKNSGIFLIGPNSHKNRIRVEISAKNKQTEGKRSTTRLHAPARSLEGALRAAFYLRVSTRGFLHSRGPAAGSVRCSRVARGAPDRTRVDPNLRPDACRLASGARLPNPRSPHVTRRSCRAPPYVGRRVAARPPLSPAFFQIFQKREFLAFSIYFLPIFLSFNP